MQLLGDFCISIFSSRSPLYNKRLFSICGAHRTLRCFAVYPKIPRIAFMFARSELGDFDLRLEVKGVGSMGSHLAADNWKKQMVYAFCLDARVWNEINGGSGHNGFKKCLLSLYDPIWSQADDFWSLDLITFLPLLIFVCNWGPVWLRLLGFQARGAQFRPTLHLASWQLHIAYMMPFVWPHTISKLTFDLKTHDNFRQVNLTCQLAL